MSCKRAQYSSVAHQSNPFFNNPFINNKTDPACEDSWDFLWLEVQNKNGKCLCKCPVLNAESQLNTVEIILA